MSQPRTARQPAAAGSSGRGDGRARRRRDGSLDGSSFGTRGKEPELKLAETVGGISIGASDPPSIALPSLRLLLVDDDSSSRAEVIDAVQAADIQVVGSTDNGRHALDMAQLLRPDLALIAWNMRRFGGALTATLMQRYAPEVTPVLLLEAEDVAEVRNAPPGVPLRSVMKHGDAGELRAMLRAIHRHGSSRAASRAKEVVDVRE